VEVAERIDQGCGEVKEGTLGGRVRVGGLGGAEPVPPPLCREIPVAHHDRRAREVPEEGGEAVAEKGALAGGVARGEVAVDQTEGQPTPLAGHAKEAAIRGSADGAHRDGQASADEDGDAPMRASRVASPIDLVTGES
jgi:hypothetical protein